MALAKALQKLLHDDEKRILVVAGALTSGPARLALEETPDRVVKVGRGEQNAILVAVGLSQAGRSPVVVLSGGQTTGRAAALFDAFAGSGEMDMVVIVHGDVPVGVALPGGGTAVHAATGADAAARLEAMLPVAGSHVLLVSGTDA